MVRPSVAALLGLTALTAGCADRTAPTGVVGGADVPRLAIAPQVAVSATRTPDDDLADLVDSVPGFGGSFLGRDGIVYAYLADPGDAQALAKLRRLVPREQRGREVRAIRGRFTARDLTRWKRSALALHKIEAVTSTDFDEATNRVTVGVTEGTAEPAVRAALASLGIPDDAVAVRVEPRVMATADLWTHDPHPKGGLTITWSEFNSGSTCTLGFIASTSTKRYGLTASHCTGAQGPINGTVFGQSDLAPGNVLGTEVADMGYSRWQGVSPTGSLIACPELRRCRWADAAAFELNATYTSQAAIGQIARTVGPPTTQPGGSITIDAANPYFTLVSSGGADYGVAGYNSTVHHIGVNGAWTAGLVSQTCADTKVFNPPPPLGDGSDTGNTELCSDRVEAYGGPGDSGGPAFMRNADGSAVAVGIVWGATSAPPYQFFYSHMQHALEGLQGQLGTGALRLLP